MALDESIGERDVVEDAAGFPVVFSSQHAAYMDRVTVDYVKGWFGRRLIIHSDLQGSC
ncbi:MAG: hypothetical protein OWU32_13810 [Firmicutes bacterium]|nr:hypothetical protein [Bacillota bacterium]